VRKPTRAKDEKGRRGEAYGNEARSQAEACFSGVILFDRGRELSKRRAFVFLEVRRKGERRFVLLDEKLIELYCVGLFHRMLRKVGMLSGSGVGTGSG